MFATETGQMAIFIGVLAAIFGGVAAMFFIKGRGARPVKTASSLFFYFLMFGPANGNRDHSWSHSNEETATIVPPKQSNKVFKSMILVR